MRFSIRQLLAVTAIVAIFCGLRSSYVLGDYAGNAITRAFFVPPMMAVVVSLYCSAILRTSPSMLKRIAYATAAGAGAAAVTMLILGWEIAAELKQMGYWNWWSDLPLFLMVMAQEVLAGGIVGLILGTLWGYILRSRSPKLQK